MNNFWNKVNKNGPLPIHKPELGVCWVWTASKFSKGYGHFSLNGVTVRAHRVSYEMMYGKIPDGLQIDHLCCNTSCVRPDHLEAVTPRINILRSLQYRRHTRTEYTKKKFCKRGHEFTPDNIYKRPNGRECRMCRTHRKYRGREQ